MEFILNLGQLKNDGCDGAIKNCTFGEHPAVLAKRNLLDQQIELLAKTAFGE
jgi:hypothetical protein